MKQKTAMQELIETLEGIKERLNNGTIEYIGLGEDVVKSNVKWPHDLNETVGFMLICARNGIEKEEKQMADNFHAGIIVSVTGQKTPHFQYYNETFKQD